MGDISENFSWLEFSRSDIARSLGIDNSIPERYKPNIKRLVDEILQPFRTRSGWVVHITSGYRCQALNDELIRRRQGAVRNSRHLTGQAADITCSYTSNGQTVYATTAQINSKFQEVGLSSIATVLQYPTRGFCHIQFKGDPVVDTTEENLPEDDAGRDVTPEDAVNVVMYRFEGWDILLNSRYQSYFVFSETGNQYITVHGLIGYLLDNHIIDRRFDNVFTERSFSDIGDGSRKNFDIIKETYDGDILNRYQSSLQDPDHPTVPVVKFGTEFYIPVEDMPIVTDDGLQMGLFINDVENFKAFWSDEQKALLQDKDYVPFEKNLLGGSASVKSTLLRKSINARVWIYSRAKDKIYDVSPFVCVCTTDKSMSSGSFSLEVVPLIDIENSWETKTEGDSLAFNYEQLTNRFNILDKDGKIVQDWFTKFVQQNDVVFIRFEKLRKEAHGLDLWYDYGDGGKRQWQPVIPPSSLTPDLLWDMIGLVDKNTQSVFSDMAEYTVQITGRDLMKLFVEDGSYFIPLRYVEAPNKDKWFYGGYNSYVSTFYRRNVVTGNFNYLMNSMFMSIQGMSWAVIDVLSNIGIVPDDLFAFCAKRKKKYLDDEGKYYGPVKGIWQMIQMWVDPILEEEQRTIVDRSLIKSEGTLFDLMKKVCQEPFVEFWGDTWNNGFTLIARKPPFTGLAIKDVLAEKQYIEITNDMLLNTSLFYDDRAYAWYRIMPQNALLGRSQFMSLAFIPIIYFDRYVEHFGNKRLLTNDVYIPNYWHDEVSTGQRSSQTGLTVLQKALLRDLLFTVETNAYLPFTRRGTIVLNGDRRIKVGTFVKLDATDELFYVTSVNQVVSFSGDSVDRTTTIVVERGMKIDLITDSWNNYFNIVNTEGIRDAIENHNNTQVPPLNDSVFNYFLERRMF